MNLQSIDWKGIAPQMGGGASVVPNGDYVAAVTAGQEKAIKSGKGKGLALEFTILEGPHKNAVVKHFLNLWHDKPEAALMARGEFALLCQCVGARPEKVQDVQQLFNRPLVIRTTVEKFTGSDGAEVATSKVKMLMPCRREGTSGPTRNEAAPARAEAAPAQDGEGDEEYGDPFA